MSNRDHTDRDRRTEDERFADQLVSDHKASRQKVAPLEDWLAGKHTKADADEAEQGHEK